MGISRNCLDKVGRVAPTLTFMVEANEREAIRLALTVVDYFFLYLLKEKLLIKEGIKII